MYLTYFDSLTILVFSVEKFERLLKTIKKQYKVYKIEIMQDCVWQSRISNPETPEFKYFSNNPVPDSYQHFVSARQSLKVRTLSNQLSKRSTISIVMTGWIR